MNENEQSHKMMRQVKLSFVSTDGTITDGASNLQAVNTAVFGNLAPSFSGH